MFNIVWLLSSTIYFLLAAFVLYVDKILTLLLFDIPHLGLSYIYPVGSLPAQYQAHLITIFSRVHELSIFALRVVL